MTLVAGCEGDVCGGARLPLSDRHAPSSGHAHDANHRLHRALAWRSRPAPRRGTAAANRRPAGRSNLSRWGVMTKEHLDKPMIWRRRASSRRQIGRRPTSRSRIWRSARNSTGTKNRSGDRRPRAGSEKMSERILLSRSEIVESQPRSKLRRPRWRLSATAGRKA
jgi:hypothetical protein